MRRWGEEQDWTAFAAWLTTTVGDGRPLTVVDVEHPTASGMSHVTSLVTARPDGDTSAEQQVVVRREPDGHHLFPDADLGRETELLRRLADVGVPVPRIVGASDDPSVLGSPFMVMEWVAGRVAPDLPSYNESGWLADAPPERRHAAWASALTMTAQLGRVDPAVVDDLFPDRGDLGGELRYWIRMLDWVTDGDPSPTLGSAGDHLAETSPETSGRGLAWGDARIGNVIFRDERAVALIDWEMASLGGPLIDLGWWLMTDRAHSEQIGIQRLEGLGSRPETVELWSAESGLDATDVAWHEAFAAFRLGVTLTRLTQLLHARGLVSTEQAAAGADNYGTRILAELLPVPPP